MTVLIREARITDADGMWRLIHELAVFERSEQEHVVPASRLAQDMQKGLFKAFVAESEGHLTGMALMFPVYSTWKGASWYLEDIVVEESHRGLGIGKQLFEKVIAFAAAQDAARLSWQVLDWNETAIRFYQKYGAELDAEWINCRIRGEELKRYKQQDVEPLA